MHYSNRFKSGEVKFLRCIINADFVSVSSFIFIGSNIFYFVANVLLLLKIFLSLCNLVYFSFELFPLVFLASIRISTLSDFSFE